MDSLYNNSLLQMHIHMQMDSPKDMEFGICPPGS